MLGFVRNVHQSLNFTAQILVYCSTLLFGIRDVQNILVWLVRISRGESNSLVCVYKVFIQNDCSIFGSIRSEA